MKLEREAARIYQRYCNYTMLTRDAFVKNILLALRNCPTDGSIIECGVWRGGISAGLADALPGRRHFLFDSFQGLPPAQDIDGIAALEWQKNTDAPDHHDNCRAEIGYAERAMRMSKAGSFELIQGWFSETVPEFIDSDPIALLRLDGDWYDSIIVCLEYLYPRVSVGGLIIIDDYYTWDGCARAVHDYLSSKRLSDRIQSFHGVCYIVKRPPEPLPS